MAYSKEKGLIAIATGYQDGEYTYTKLNLNWVQAESITSTPEQIMDVDSYRNANGYLKRTVLDHAPAKWEANTTILYEEDVDQLLNLLQDGFSVNDDTCSKNKRQLRIRYYNEWEHGYSHGHFYVPDIAFSYKTVLNDKLVYQPIRFAFVEL